MADWLFSDGSTALNFFGTGTYTVGHKFKVDAAIHVTDLSIKVVETAATDYTLKLWDTTTQTVIATATFTVDTSTTMWVAVTPVDLIADREYLLTWTYPNASNVCYETGAVNTWRVNPPVAGVTMSVLGGVIEGAGNAYPSTFPQTDNDYVFSMGLGGTTFSVEDDAVFYDELSVVGFVAPEPAFLEIVALGSNEGSEPTPPQTGPPDGGVIPDAAVVQIGTPDPQPTGGVPVDFVVAQPAGMYALVGESESESPPLPVLTTSDWLLAEGTQLIGYGTGYTNGTKFKVDAVISMTAIGVRAGEWLPRTYILSVWDTTTSTAVASGPLVIGSTGWAWLNIASVDLVPAREYVVSFYNSNFSAAIYREPSVPNGWRTLAAVAGVTMQVYGGQYYAAGDVYPGNHNPNGSNDDLGIRGTAAGGAGPSTATPPPASATTISPTPTVVASTPALSVTPATAQITAVAATPTRVAGPVTVTPPAGPTTTTAVIPVITAGVAPQTVTPATAPTIATVPTPIRVAVATFTALAAAAALIAMGPSISGAITRTPNAAVMTSASPTATTSATITRTPAPATITAANGPPATATTVTRTPPAAIMTSTVPTPSAFIAGAVLPQTAPATFAVPTPTRVTGGVITTPAAGTITATVPTPTIIAGATVGVPATAAMTATSPPPTRAVGVAIVTASPAVLTSNVPTPSATAAGVISPAPAVLLATIPAPVSTSGPVSATAASAVMSSGVPTAQVNNTATTIPQAAVVTANAPAPARQVGTATVTPPAAMMTAIQPSPAPAQTGAPKIADVNSTAGMIAVVPSPTLRVTVTPLAATASFIVPSPLLGTVTTPAVAPLNAQAASPTAIPGAAIAIPDTAAVTVQAVTPTAGSIAGGERKITLIAHRAKVVSLRV